jgi:D-amino-acid dehydrogenase
MLRAAGEYLVHPPATPGDTATAIRNGAWSGLRPLTPDGLPVLGLIPGFTNLSVATGHAMLGITLGPATGEVMAELIVQVEAPQVMRPFDPARFIKGSRPAKS